MQTDKEKKFPFLLKLGRHKDDSSECCLMEASSLQPSAHMALCPSDLIAPVPGRLRTDRGDDVCSVRAAFARSLNDAYDDDTSRTVDLWRLVCTLRHTKKLRDSVTVADFLRWKLLKDWYPMLLKFWADVSSQAGHSQDALKYATLSESVRQEDCMSGVLTLYRQAGFQGAIDVAGGFRNDVIFSVHYYAHILSPIAIDYHEDRIQNEVMSVIRRSMADALLETCQPGWDQRFLSVDRVGTSGPVESAP